MDIKVITICGSMRYSKEMMKIAEELIMSIIFENVLKIF